MLAPQGWFNQVDFPSQWSQNNTDKAENHRQWQGLSANHKAAYEASVVETAKYAGGVTRSLVFQPHFEVFRTGKLLVLGVEIKIISIVSPCF